jgi:hypothetical protein
MKLLDERVTCVVMLGRATLINFDLRELGETGVTK